MRWGAGRDEMVRGRASSARSTATARPGRSPPACLPRVGGACGRSQPGCRRPGHTPPGCRRGGRSPDSPRAGRSRPGARSASIGEQVDDGCRVRAGGADGYAELGGGPGEGAVPAQVHQADQGTLVRWELAAAVTFARDDEHGDPLDQGVRQVACGKIRSHLCSCACGLRLRTPPPPARASCVSDIDTVTRSVATLNELSNCPPVPRTVGCHGPHPVLARLRAPPPGVSPPSFESHAGPPSRCPFSAAARAVRPTLAGGGRPGRQPPPVTQSSAHPRDVQRRPHRWGPAHALGIWAYAAVRLHRG